MDGQALHFRWGDGSKFICEETKDCMAQGVMVKELGKFRGVNRSWSWNIIRKQSLIFFLSYSGVRWT